MENGEPKKKQKYYTSFYQNLKDGIIYYRNLPGLAKENRDAFLKALEDAGTALTLLSQQLMLH